MSDQERVWSAVKDALGLTGTAAAGDRVRIAVHGVAPVAGVVEFADLPTALGVRAGNGLYPFIHGYKNTVVVEYHDFSADGDEQEAEKAWLSGAFA